MTKMVGGVISGYWAMGSVNSAIAPSNTIKIESTDAKIGRRMKKCENFTTRGSGLRLRFRGPGRPGFGRGLMIGFGFRAAAPGLRHLYLNLPPSPQHHQAVHDHPVLGRQPF